MKPWANISFITKIHQKGGHGLVERQPSKAWGQGRGSLPTAPLVGGSVGEQNWPEITVFVARAPARAR